MRPLSSAPLWLFALAVLAGCASTKVISQKPAVSAVTPSAPGEPTDKSLCIRYSDNLSDDITAANSIRAKCVYIPPGTHNYSGEIKLNGIKLIGDGDTSILKATDPNNRKIRIGTGGGLYNLKLYTLGTQRIGGHDAVQIDGGASNWVINNVTVDGSNAAGIITFGGHDGRITNNRVLNTKADSIHISAGANRIYVAGNYIRNSGDDCIAVVTYQKQNRPNSRDILIENNDVADQPWGRGITVVGGENVTIRNNRIVKTSGAGIYLYSESSYQTLGVNNVIVDNNIIDQPSYAHPEHGQPAIDISSQTSYPVGRIILTNNTITSSPHGPFRITITTHDVYCNGNTYNGAPVTPANATGNAGVTGTSIDAMLLY